MLVALGLGLKRHWHILLTILLGFMAGWMFPYEEYIYVPLYEFFYEVADMGGQVFIRLITMIVLPLVISSLIIGVSSLGDTRQLGVLGSKVLSLFIMFMVVASLIGTGLGLFFKPGKHVKASIENHQTQLADFSAHQTDVDLALKQNNQDLKQLFFNMIPSNPIESLVKMDLVPVIVFTLLFGVAIAYIGDAGTPLVSFFESVFTATMKLTDWIMVLSPLGVFFLSFVTVTKTGPQVFMELSWFILVMIAAFLVQVLIVFPVALRLLARIDFSQLYSAVSEALMVAFGTASSSATLPVTIACCERQAGISNRIASFVLPTGASINKTGTTMFEVVAVLFLMQAYGVELELPTIILISVFAVIASIGTAGVPSAGIITMAIVLNSIGENFNPNLFPLGIAMLWSVDRVVDMCRTTVNVLSSCVVAAIVAAGEGELNRDVLSNKTAGPGVI
ncbi:MAG: dicarboxylate/amino acid:cation symporter [Vampirovibrio sp.]|nr:dicarboxylate/amino acid:cation symporter [Vampirovibrio sp.]